MDKTPFFPKPSILFPESVGWLPESEGWASKGAAALKTKHVRFTTEQGNFLKKKNDEGTNGGHKIWEHDEHQQMKDLFKDKDPNSLFSLQLVLTTTQIKLSFSSQNHTRKKLAAKRVIDQVLLDARATMDFISG